MSKTRPLHSPEFFEKLVQLGRQQPWLQSDSKEKALNELWMLCDDDEQMLLLCQLLERFKYVTLDERMEVIQLLANHIVSVWKLTPNNTIILGIKDNKGLPDSSVILQRDLAIELNSKASYGAWSEEENFRTMGDFPHAVPLKDNQASEVNVVFVDDFCGTAGTLEKANKLLLSRLGKTKNGHIHINKYALFIAAMEMAKEKIESNAFTHHVFFWMKKGISDYFQRDSEVYINQMIDLESKLSEKYGNKPYRLRDFSLGYNQSEALWGIEPSRASNNVFPIFWWPLLKHSKERPTLLRKR